MRYSLDHKQATRRRILEVASRAFRERGVAETGIDEVMKRAGLTHGGFYAHFRDKGELVAEACAAGFAEAGPNLERIARLPTAAARVRVLVDSYLAVRHRDNRGSGCLIVAVAADMARLPAEARAGFSAAFQRHLVRLGEALRLSEEPEENRARVTQLMSALVGALLFARALADPRESETVLHTMRRRLKAEHATDPERARGEAPAARTGRKEPGAFSPSHGLLRTL